MPSAEASTKQVFRWALNHAGVLIAAAGIIGTLYVGWDRLQTQWTAHMEEGTQRDHRFERLDKKVDQLQDTSNKILLLLARRGK